MSPVGTFRVIVEDGSNDQPGYEVSDSIRLLLDPGLDVFQIAGTSVIVPNHLTINSFGKLSAKQGLESEIIKWDFWALNLVFGLLQQSQLSGGRYPKVELITRQELVIHLDPRHTIPIRRRLITRLLLWLERYIGQEYPLKGISIDTRPLGQMQPTEPLRTRVSEDAPRS